MFSRKNILLFISISFLLLTSGGVYFLVTPEKNISSPSLVPDIDVQSGSVSVVLTEAGFKPNQIVIEKGTTIVFSTELNKTFWPASNLHPSHSVYPAFDPKEPILPDKTWSFTFDDIGEWDFHDHLRSYFVGTIYVIES